MNEYAGPPTRPGGGRHHGLAKELSNLGHKVCVVRSDYDHIAGWYRESGDSDGVEYRVLPTGFYGSQMGRVTHMVRFGQLVGRQVANSVTIPDLILGSTPHSFQAHGAMRLARRLGVPFALEIRDIWPLSLTELGIAERWHPFVLGIGMLEEHLAKGAVGIVTTSPGTEDYLKERYALETPVVWIPNGPTERLVGCPEPFDGGSHLVMYAGAMGSPNAIDTIVEAAAVLRESGWPSETLTFEFIGAGDRRSEAEALVQSLGVDGVRFADPIPKQRVPELLGKASVLVLATRGGALYRYGLSPNKLTDYMAAARPIAMASDVVGGLVVESGCGVMARTDDPVDLANAIAEILVMSPYEQRQMGMRGRRYVENHLSLRHRARLLSDALEDWRGSFLDRGAPEPAW